MTSLFPFPNTGSQLYFEAKDASKASQDHSVPQCQ